MLQVLRELRAKALKRAGLTEEQVLEQIKERTAFRKNKEYEKSDAIRISLESLGICLMDGKDGTTTWRPAVPSALREQHV